MLAASSDRKQSKTASKNSGGGFGKKLTKPSPVIDSATLLRQSMDLYDILSKSVDEFVDDEDPVAGFREYVVCVRHCDNVQLADWVPVSCMGLRWSGDSLTDKPSPEVANPRLALPSAVRHLRREIWECACQAAPSLLRLSRTEVEYAVEPLDDFSAVLEAANSRGSSMSEAYKTLGIDRGSSPRDVKTAHRKLVMAHHPDTMVGKPEAERAEAEKKFREVQAAYEVLGGGQGDQEGSWYARLGGKSRSDKFSGRLDLSAAGDLGSAWLAAVEPLDPTLVQDFMARNAMHKER